MYPIYSKIYNYRYQVFSQFVKIISISILVKRIFLALADTSINIFLKTDVKNVRKKLYKIYFHSINHAKKCYQIISQLLMIHEKNCGFGGKSMKIGTHHAEYTCFDLSYTTKPDFLFIGNNSKKSKMAAKAYITKN